MIFVKNTPNNLGAAIYGDYKDFDKLYEALHNVVGDENEDGLIPYNQACLRVLAVCYDIRHALMGDREYEFVDNGLDEDKKRYMEVLAPDKNIYFKINVLWPEMLFVMITLNDLLEYYALKTAKIKRSNNLYEKPKVVWDSTVAQVRMLQSAVSECLSQTIVKGAYTRLLNVMNSEETFAAGYLTQYIDLLNYDFIYMSNENRLKNISIFGKRISERSGEYWDLEEDLMEEAKKQNCHVSELRLNLDYPEEVEW